MISFWDCPNSDKWPSYLLVDKELKHLKINTVLPSKSSWEFGRKEKCNSIIYKWQMYFQASEYKRRNFLDLNDDNNQPIHLTYSKGSAWLWLKHFGLSNSMLPDWLQIMLLLVNIGLGFSLKNLLHACVEILLLRWGHTFYISVYGTRSLGRNPLKMFSFFFSFFLLLLYLSNYIV